MVSLFFFMLFFAREKYIPFYEERGKIGILEMTSSFEMEKCFLFTHAFLAVERDCVATMRNTFLFMFCE